MWVGSSRGDVREFPREVRRDIGRALNAAQDGEIDPAEKPMPWLWRRLHRRDHRTSSRRHLASRAHRLFCRSDLRFARVPNRNRSRGIATPKRDIELIRQRLAEAERLHRERQN